MHEPLLGNVLRRTLEALQMSQAELARECKMSAKQINMIIQGRVDPSDGAVMKIAEVTGIPASVWLVLVALDRARRISTVEEQVTK